MCLFVVFMFHPVTQGNENQQSCMHDLTIRCPHKSRTAVNIASSYSFIGVYKIIMNPIGSLTMMITHKQTLDLFKVVIKAPPPLQTTS